MANEMSSLSQIEESTAGSSNQQQNEERQSAVVAICLGCLLIGTLLGLLFFVASNVILGGDGKGEGETGAPGVYAKGQPGGPPESFSPKHSPAPTTTPRTLPPFTLICTVHFDSTYSQWLTPPEDKTCDFIFYDSLHQNQCQIYLGSPYTWIYFRQKDIIFNLASTVYVHTRIGVSVEFVDWEAFQKKLRSNKGKSEIDEYNAVKIRDWGFLNLNQLYFRQYPDVIKEAFIMLKELAQYQASQKVESYMLLGVYLENETICDKVVNLLNTVFTPHGIISLGHTSIGCSYVIDTPQNTYFRSLPPNCDFDPYVEFPLVTTNQYLGQAVKAVRCLQSKGINTMFALSLTVAPLYYELCGMGEGRMLNFFALCGYAYNRVEIQWLCSQVRDFEEDDKYNTVVSNDDDYGFGMFDNLKFIKKKACGTWQGTKDLRLGVSIYDINFDYIWQNAPNSNESRKTCPNETMWDGDWVRTNYLLKFRHFLANDYANMENEQVFEDRCINL